MRRRSSHKIVQQHCCKNREAYLIRIYNKIQKLFDGKEINTTVKNLNFGKLLGVKESTVISKTWYDGKLSSSGEIVQLVSNLYNYNLSEKCFSYGEFYHIFTPHNSRSYV